MCLFTICIFFEVYIKVFLSFYFLPSSLSPFLPFIFNPHHRIYLLILQRGRGREEGRGERERKREKENKREHIDWLPPISTLTGD